MKVWWKTKVNIGFSEEFRVLYALGGTQTPISHLRAGLFHALGI